MKKTIMGEYEFRNSIMLNPKLAPSMIDSTVVHEHTHLILSQSTVYGLTMQCLKKLILLAQLKLVSETRCKRLEKFLLDNMQKTQEAIAVFSEVCLHVDIGGWEEANSFINELRTGNREYYKYLSELDCIIDVMRKDQVIEEQLEELAALVFSMGRAALNAPIFSMDTKIFKDKSDKALKQFLSGGNISEYLPNKIFKKKIGCIKKLEPSNVAELIEVLHKVIEDSDTDNTDLHLAHNRLEKVKCFLIDIFSDDKNLNRIKFLLDNIQFKEVLIKDIIFQQLPIHNDIATDLFHKVKQLPISAVIKRIKS